MSRYRNNELYFSDEVIFYLGLEAKRIVEGTDASMTLDNLADGICRKILTEQNPDYVLAWVEYEKAKQEAAKTYQTIKNKAIGRREVREAA